MFKKKEPEPVITMTADELAALVDARIAERDAKGRREAEEAKKPKPEAGPPEAPRRYSAPCSPELEAALLELYDAVGTRGLNGDSQMYEVAWMIYGQSSGRQEWPDKVIRDPRQPDRQLSQLIEAWRGCSVESLDWMERLTEQSMVVNLVKSLDFKRKHPNYRAEEVAARVRLERGIIDNASYWQEARRPSDLTLEELQDLAQAKRAQGAKV